MSGSPAGIPCAFYSRAALWPLPSTPAAVNAIAARALGHESAALSVYTRPVHPDDAPRANQNAQVLTHTGGLQQVDNSS